MNFYGNSSSIPSSTETIQGPKLNEGQRRRNVTESYHGASPTIHKTQGAPSVARVDNCTERSLLLDARALSIGDRVLRYVYGSEDSDDSDDPTTPEDDPQDDEQNAEECAGESSSWVFDCLPSWNFHNWKKYFVAPWSRPRLDEPASGSEVENEPPRVTDPLIYPGM